MGSIIKQCIYCDQAIELNDRTGRYLAYNENGSRHFCRGKKGRGIRDNMAKMNIIKDPLGKIYRTVSIQEYNKLKQALEQANKEIEAVRTQCRKEIIAALHAGIRCFKDDQDRNRSIDSFANSKMTLEEVSKRLDPLRDIKTSTSTSSSMGYIK